MRRGRASDILYVWKFTWSVIRNRGAAKFERVSSTFINFSYLRTFAQISFDYGRITFTTALPKRTSFRYPLIKSYFIFPDGTNSCNSTIHIVFLLRQSCRIAEILSRPISHDADRRQRMHRRNNTPSCFDQVKMPPVCLLNFGLFLFRRRPGVGAKGAAKRSIRHDTDDLFISIKRRENLALTGVFSREAKCLSTRESMTWTDVGLNWRNDHNRGPTQRVCDLFFRAPITATDPRNS